MATARGDVRFQGKTGSSRPTTEMTRLTHVGPKGCSLAGTCPPSPVSCRASVARCGQTREKWSVGGKSFGYELCEQPHAFRLARLSLRQKPKRAVHVQVGARHPRQQRVGVSNEARQRRYSDPLPYRGKLRLTVRDPQRDLSGANLAFACPIRNSVIADDDPPHGIGRAHTPRGQSVARDVDGAEQIRAL